MKKIAAVLLVLILSISALVACTPSSTLDEIAKIADKYTIVGAYDAESHTLSATQTTTVTNHSENTFDNLKFHIYANSYREGAAHQIVADRYKSKAYKNGTSYGDIAFDSVSVGENAVAFVIEGEDSDILSVPVPSLYPNESVTVTFVYEIHLANIYHRLGYGDNTVNLGNFYPVLCQVRDGAFVTNPYYSVGDPFVSEMANFDVTLTVPSTYVVAHSGNLQEVTNGEGTSTYKICQDAVRDFAVVLSDKFVKKTQAAGDVTINYYYFADLEPEVSVAAVLSALQFMQEKVGKYPYSQLSVVETDFCYGGMEYPNLVMVSSGSQDYTTAAAHEVIHQWFYGVVGNDQIEHAWMDEGLTEFLTLAYLDYSLTTPLADSIKERNRAYLSFVDVLKNYFKELNTSYRPTYGYKSEQEYQYITYLKGSLMFNKAYEIMGKDRFYKALTHYFNNNAGKIAAPADLINSFTKANSSDMSEFFKAFIDGKDMLFTQ